jgi:UDP-2,3-diacylglucosamine pyrophosphatase LpxH|tara:strand:- start:4978 stop:6018 length:1041 start_codon:yes stop_codon:yes gene_type:complete
MLTAIITDTHFGARKGSKLFHDYFEKFYNDIFFPALDEKGITTVIHMGDAFDSRKGIDFKALDWSKRVVFEPLKQRGITMHLMVGNHDAYYKNTNSINAIDLLLEEYDNVITYSQATEVEVGGLPILFIPWINEENSERTFKLIETSSCKCAMGHLELTGFRAHRGCIMENGHDSKFFENYEVVFSGHYHTRSSDGKIFYLGNPYEMFWNDVNDERGFHFFDTETLEHTPVNNPYQLFHNIYYEDTDHQLFDATTYSDKIVKVIVKKKSDITKFEKFIDKLYSVGVHDLKIVENFQLVEADDFEAGESEDTLSILDRYIQEADTDLDKDRIQKMMRHTYQEACELI